MHDRVLLLFLLKRV